MPKVKSLRSKAKKHQSAPKIHAEPVEQDEVANEEPSETEDVEGYAREPALTKKERRLFKREAFQEHVAETLEKTVHSKSAQRRAKRREKERLASDLSDMGAILRNVLQGQDHDQGQDQDVSQSGVHPKIGSSLGSAKPAASVKPGQIGESTRTRPLSKQQKKKALQLEQKRLPLILTHPQFVKNPFATIRSHNANALAQVGSGKET